MAVTLVGTGTGVPSKRRNSPCVSVELGDKCAIFDSGPGSLKNLLHLGVDFLNIDLLFYTHLHMDHIADLGTMLFAAKIPPSLRRKALVVYGPSGLTDYYKNLRHLYGKTISSDTYTLELKEIENKDMNIETFRISTRTLRHHDGSMGYRIISPAGNILVYSGDTDYCDEIIELSRDADLCLLECSFPDEMKMNGHLTPGEAGEVAHRSNVKKLVLLHMYPVCDRYDLLGPCKEGFAGEVIVGEDFMKFEFV